jgi:hypothetical protein
MESLYMSKPDKTLDRFWDLRQRDLLALLEATPAGTDLRRSETASASAWPK